jgi:PleD family two-component response regulator
MVGTIFSTPSRAEIIDDDRAGKAAMSKILLVDDDAFIVEAYSQKLRQAGFDRARLDVTPVQRLRTP